MFGERGPAWVPGRRRDPTGGTGVPLAVILMLFAWGAFGIGDVGWTAILASIAVACWLYARPDVRARIVRRVQSWSEQQSAELPVMSAAGLHGRALSAGSGAYLATGERGEWISAPPESAVLVLAGPRAGKTTCVVIPALLAHPGAAIATSTKPEVLNATLGARREIGEAWFFDLQGHGAPAGTRPLRWSPVTQAEDWQRAQLLAEAMTGSAEVDRDAAHWIERSGALIASCLHAAAGSGQGMRELVGWVLRHDADAPLAELDPGSLAHDVLSGIKHTADRERASIFSTAARVLRAYRSETALRASEHENFDADRFAVSTDTIYIAASAHDQRLLAPLVVGLLSEIREAVYRRYFSYGRPPIPLLFMLDECANIAPLPDLPAMLSEGGGHGVHTVTVFQDMSQARRRWRLDADGMLSLFGAKVVMSGIADKETLEQLSLLCGEWDRPVQTITDQHPALFSRGHASTSDAWTTRRERRLPPDEIAQLPLGQALVMIGPQWQIFPTLPYHLHRSFAYIANGLLPVVEASPNTKPHPGPHQTTAPDGGGVTEPRRGEGKEAKRP